MPRIATHQDRDAQILDQRARGSTAAQIAARLGISRGAVIGVWNRNARTDDANPSPWTPALTARLVELIAEGRSAGFCSEALGFTRAATFQKGRRLGLRFRGRKQSSPQSNRQSFASAGTSGSLDSTEGCPMIKPMDLLNHHCRWPFGEPGDEDFAHCGKPKVGDSSYCAAHYTLAHVTTPPKWFKRGADLARSLRRYA